LIFQLNNIEYSSSSSKEKPEINLFHYFEAEYSIIHKTISRELRFNKGTGTFSMGYTLSPPPLDFSSFNYFFFGIDV